MNRPGSVPTGLGEAAESPRLPSPHIAADSNGSPGVGEDFWCGPGGVDPGGGRLPPILALLSPPSRRS